MMFGIEDRVRESNRIEGIHRKPNKKEIEAYNTFISLEEVTRYDLINFVHTIQKGAFLRSMPGVNVRVGNHYPPAGGKHVVATLDDLIRRANSNKGDDYQAYKIHHQYETLHPFTDGNGRSGRMLWYWMMGHEHSPLGFLHHWYYQTLRYRRME